MCVWNSGHTCGDVFWPLNDHINNYWALREVLLYLTFIFPDMKTQTSPGPTVQRASSHASSLDLHVKSSHSQLTRLAAFEACWASFCRRQAQRDGTPGYEEGRWRNGRRGKRRRRIRPEGLLICFWEWRKETEQEAEVHLRASEERTGDCIRAEAGFVGLLLCSKIRGSRKHFFRIHRSL